LRRIIALALLAAAFSGGLFVAPALASPRLVPVERLSASLPAPGTPVDGAVARGLDTSQRPTAAGYEAIAAAGYSFMGRYLYIPGGSKIYPVTTAELANARAAGVGVFLIFEWCDRAHLPSGYEAGQRDGQIAATSVAALGLPPDSTAVYFSLDRTPYATTGAAAYFEGVRSTYPGAVGSYGSYWQLTTLAREGLIDYLWYATWMDGNNLPFSGWGNQMYQRTIIKRVGGVYCDQNWSYCRDIGVVGHDAAP
jgi:hypothetical protein